MKRRPHWNFSSAQNPITFTAISRSVVKCHHERRQARCMYHFIVKKNATLICNTVLRLCSVALNFPIQPFSVIRQWNLNNIVRIRRRIFFSSEAIIFDCELRRILTLDAVCTYFLLKHVTRMCTNMAEINSVTSRNIQKIARLHAIEAEVRRWSLIVLSKKFITLSYIAKFSLA